MRSQQTFRESSDGVYFDRLLNCEAVGGYQRFEGKYSLHVKL
jgi:hypothetical protein